MNAPQATAEAPASPTGPLSRRRRRLFRLAAVALGLAPFFIFELACVALGWGRPELFDDPLVGFSSVRPLFVPTSDGLGREIPPARHPWFCHDSFAVPKPAHEFRAFVLGGSTVQGHPFARQTSFTTWLEISLAAADPARSWRFINCGGVSYATYRLVPILEEVLNYQPDLIIIYEGHNEFLEARSFEHLHRGGLLTSAVDAASRLRTFTLLREGYLRLQGRSSAEPSSGRTILPTEVEALLDYRGGLERYHRDDAMREDIIRQYAFNLRRMVEMCRERGVEVMLVNPVSKLRDCPPFKSEHDADLSPEQLARWQELTAAAANQLRRGSLGYARALELYQQAAEIDPRHAGGQYNLAECHDLLEQYDEARAAYLAAKDADVCPLRILQPMNDAVLEIAHEQGTLLFDANQLFVEHSKNGIPGGDWLIDHAHPTIAGHQLLADEISALLVARGVIHKPVADWQQIRTARYQEHFDGLDPLYFEKGMQRLKGLTDWAAGRARQLRPGDSSRSPAEQGTAVPSASPAAPPAGGNNRSPR
jgi:tetratricopeptide (TPR) repeat protein